jgi:hypothetical protein
VEIRLTSQDAYDGSNYIYSAADDMSKILEKIIKQYGGDKYDTVHFVVKGKAVDQYGKSSDAEVFRVTYDMSEVRKVDFSNVYPIYLLNRFTVGNLDIGPIGKPALLAFCSDYHKEAPDFCRKVLSK